MKLYHLDKVASLLPFDILNSLSFMSYFVNLKPQMYVYWDLLVCSHSIAISDIAAICFWQSLPLDWNAFSWGKIFLNFNYYQLTEILFCACYLENLIVANSVLSHWQKITRFIKTKRKLQNNLWPCFLGTYFYSKL